MDVYIVRHGESEGNANKVHSGWSAVPLTEKGRAQASKTGTYLREIPFDRYFVSDLNRTQQTAALVFPDMTDRFTLVQEIREYDNGWFVGKPFSYMEERFGEDYLRWRRELDYSPIGGETPAHFFGRVSAFMKRLEALEGCERVAVVSHAGVLRNMAQYVLGVPYKDGPLATANCGVTVLRWQNGRWTVRVWNWTPELPE